MANRKQVSFVRGEVSPSYRFKSSSVGYAEGLYKLKNGYVRRGGGVSNRAGFAYLATLDDTGIAGRGTRSNTKLLAMETEINEAVNRFVFDDSDGNPVFRNVPLFAVFRRLLFLRAKSNVDEARTIIEDFVLDNLDPEGFDYPRWWDLEVFSSFSIEFDSPSFRNPLYKGRITQLQNGQALLNFGEGKALNINVAKSFDSSKVDLSYETVNWAYRKTIADHPALSLSQYPQKTVIDNYFDYKADDGRGTPYDNLPFFKHRVGMHIRGDSRATPSISGAYIVTCEYANGDERILFATDGPVTSYAGKEVIFEIGEFEYNDAFRSSPIRTYEFFGPGTRWSGFDMINLFGLDLINGILVNNVGENFNGRLVITSHRSYLHEYFFDYPGAFPRLPSGIGTNDAGQRLSQVALYCTDEKAKFNKYPEAHLNLAGIDTNNPDDRVRAWTTATPILAPGRRYLPRPEGNVFKLYRSTQLNGVFSLVWITRIPEGGTPGRRVSTPANGPIILRDPGVQIPSSAIRDRLRLFGRTKVDAVEFDENILYQHVYTTPLSGFTTPLAFPQVPSQRLYLPYMRSQESGRVPIFGRATTITSTSFGRSVIYQQRQYVSYTVSGQTEETQYRAVIGVSAINSYLDFTTADDIEPTKAFEFNIPIEDSGKVVAMVASERLLVFTTEKAYLIAGNSDSGIITPTEVNPVTIYVGGCSEEVEPVRAENKVIFLNNDHSSIVSVDFGSGRGSGVRISETDGFAKHFLEKSIIQMAVTTSFETIIWLLREDGALLSMTQFPEGVYGFGIHELSDGYIENIASTRLAPLYRPSRNDNGRWRTPDVETLAATIVRDTVDEEGNRIGQIRTLEAIVPRDDVHPEGMNYLDGMRTFGHRLIKGPTGVWVSTSPPNGGNIFLQNVPESESIEDFKHVTGMIRDFMVFGQTPSPTGTHSVGSEWITFYSTLTTTQTRDFTVIESQFNLTHINSFIEGGGLKNGYEETEDVRIINRLAQNRRYINITGRPNSEEKDKVEVLFYVTDNIVNFFDQGEDGSELQMVRREGMYWFFNLLFKDAISLDTTTTNYKTHGQANLDDRGHSLTFSTLTQREQDLLIKFINGMYYLKRPIFPDEIAVYYGDGERVVLKKEGDDFQGVPPSLAAGKTVSEPNEPTRNVFFTRRPNAFDSAYLDEIAKGARVRVNYVVEGGGGELPEELSRVLTTPSSRPPVGSIEEKERLSRASRWVPMTDRVEGLTHLKNKTVSVFADNEEIPNLKVDNDGVLDLKEQLRQSFAWGSVGIPYQFEMESLPIDAKSERLIDGKKVVNVLVAALYRTGEGEMGSISEEETNETDRTFPISETVSRLQVDKNGLYSGAIQQNLASAWSVGGRVRIVQPKPKPITVNAIYPKGVESGGR